MITHYKSSTYIINCDWLQFSVLLTNEEPFLICPDGVRIEICQGNNIFEHRALVYSGRGEKLLTLLWKPYSKVIQRNIMTVQVANQSLYVTDGMGIQWAWELVQDIVDCTFNAIGRLDLCIDYEATEKQLTFLRHLNSGHYYVQGKREGSTWWHNRESNNFTHKELHCLSWGSKTSEIKVKTYNKSREQGTLSGNKKSAEKPWIVDEWEAAGMNITKVWRLEFSLSGAGQLQFDNKTLTLDMVRDEKWRTDVICQMYHSRFVTRINQGKRYGHKNNDTQVFLINLPKRGRLLKWKVGVANEYECPASITLLRSMMRNLDNPAIVSNKPSFEAYAGAIVDIIRLHHLDGYFIRTWEAAPDDYFNNIYDNIGVGVHTTIVPPSRLSE